VFEAITPFSMNQQLDVTTIPLIVLSFDYKPM
jgi:hypothetical protein